ncbi:MAG: class I SAM-dependent methyltransferase [Pseudomonadota bacterium]|nr:class I SAM-dependent methyltransferase [Pseudomonadota bacterium]
MNPGDGFLHRDCPLCGTAAPAVADVRTEPAAESMPYEALVPHWNGFFKERVFFSYGRCASCGLLFAPRFFDEGQLGDLYAQMAPNMGTVPLDALRRTQRGYFEVLKAHSSLEGGYIEVGPDIGLFTESCVREGRFDSYWLFEPNRDVAAALSEVVAGRDHRIVHDMLGFSQAPDRSVGAAILIHVLDHLLDPAGVLRELRAKLLPAATILIVTHNESSLLRRAFGRRWPAFCLQHPELYNPRSMRALLDSVGYEVIQIRRTVNHFPVQFLLKHLLWAVGLKVDRTPAFGGLAIGLRLGNMITVARPRADLGNAPSLAPRRPHQAAIGLGLPACQGDESPLV